MMKKQYDFVERAAHYAKMDTNALWYALNDARKTVRACRGTDAEGYYLDDCSTIMQEIKRRKN